MTTDQNEKLGKVLGSLLKEGDVTPTVYSKLERGRHLAMGKIPRLESVSYSSTGLSLEMIKVRYVELLLVAFLFFAGGAFVFIQTGSTTGLASADLALIADKNTEDYANQMVNQMLCEVGSKECKTK